MTTPPDDPCDRTEPHIPHRNWRSEEVGVCPGSEPDGDNPCRCPCPGCRNHCSACHHRKDDR